jgi:hypothetical protein
VTSIKGVQFILRASKTCESITLVLHIIHLAPSDLRPATLSILFARDPHHCVYPQVRALPTVDQRPRKSNVSLRIIPSNRLQHITSSLSVFSASSAPKGKKHLLTASYRLAKLETRVLVRNPFFRTRGCGQGDQENTEREENRVAFHIQDEGRLPIHHAHHSTS